MNWLAGILAFFGLSHPALQKPPPAPPPSYLVRMSSIEDEKSVFATIQSTYTVPARVRTGGTIVDLKVRQGDQVAAVQPFHPVIP